MTVLLRKSMAERLRSSVPSACMRPLSVTAVLLVRLAPATVALARFSCTRESRVRQTPIMMHTASSGEQGYVDHVVAVLRANVCFAQHGQAGHLQEDSRHVTKNAPPPTPALLSVRVSWEALKPPPCTYMAPPEPMRDCAMLLVNLSNRTNNSQRL